MRLRLIPDEWVRVPESRVELNAEYGGAVERNASGWWDLSAVPGRVVARVVLPGGRRSWPWPIVPLPQRTSTATNDRPGHKCDAGRARTRRRGVLDMTEEP